MSDEPAGKKAAPPGADNRLRGFQAAWLPSKERRPLEKPSRAADHWKRQRAAPNGSAVARANTVAGVNS
jgi:hypothetical protein